MRSPAQMDIIQIDANVACHKRCSNCTRLVAHQTTKWEMSPEQVKVAIQSMEGWYKPGHVLGLIGGEVTLHSEFESIARVFRENWNPEKKVSLGGQPIKDFNAFANERLFDRTSGRGLWTSLGAGFYRHMEAIFETFDHWNTNTHESSGLHQAMLISRKDYCEATGITDDQWLEARSKCWVQNLWSASINDKGAYPCEIMASIDRLYFNGSHAWPVEKGWWERKPEDFGAMLDLCNYCSLAQRGPSQIDNIERDIISVENIKLLEDVGSPAVKKSRYETFDPAVHTEQRQVDTKDNYVDEYRVSPEHSSTKPKKLSCVVVCVGRAEHLAKTLPHNAPLFDEIVVVTTGDDQATADVVIGYRDRDLYKDEDGALYGSHDVSVKLVCCNRCYEDGHAFNKGKMLNAGLAALTKPDWICLTDADVFLHPKLREFVMGHTLNPGVLYGAARNHAHEDALPYMEPGDFKPQKELLARQRFDGTIDMVDHEPNGYFQLFNRNAKSLRGRLFMVGKNGIQAGPMCENFCSAGGIDSWFMQQFPPDKRVFIPEMPVVHIAHGDFGSGWNGQDLRPGWRQWGMYTLGGFVKTDQRNGAVKRIKLTDTLHGETWEGEPMKAPLETTGKRLIFQGKDIGHHHVHVAYWNEGA